MTGRSKKLPPALKHAGYSATSVLPGESAADFEKLHQELICEWNPDGVLEDDIIATMARAQWRKKNLTTFRIARLARRRMAQIRDAMVPGTVDQTGSDDRYVELEKAVIEKWNAAEDQGRAELGELYALVEMGEEVTFDHLMKELQVEDRLDAIIDRCLKRLVLVRGIKSISSERSSAQPERIPGPQKIA